MAVLSALLDGLPWQRLQGCVGIDVTGITADSRRVEPGWVFVAIRGLNTDGHQFVAQAIGRGAAAVVVEHAPDVRWSADVVGVRIGDTRRALAHMAAAFYGHAARHLRLIGVTGTSGKTTTTYLLEAMLRACGMAPGVIGTVTYRYGGREYPSEQTTPPAEDLQSLLRQMVESGMSHCALEVSSHALALDRVWGCQFAAALFTNLSRDHLDFHQDMASYYAAKARLFVEYEPDLAIINRDDPAGQRLLAETPAPVITYGFTSHADVAVEHLRMHPRGSVLRAKVQGRGVEVRSPLIGRHNAYNVLCALATASGLGLELDAAIQGVESLAVVPGRFDPVDAGQPFSVLVDYAHKPEALRQALIAARDIASGRVIVVFGAGGDRDRGKRPSMGQVAAEHADMAVITSDNPRGEAPLEIMHAIARGYKAAAGRPPSYIIEDRRCAIEEALALARAGDAVVIAGKGHEAYQIIGSQRLPFDDREVAKQALYALGFRRSGEETECPGGP